MKARNLTYSGELLCRRNYFVGTSLKVLSYSYPSGAGGNPPLSPSMIRGSSFIALIVETTCSVLILDQSGSPQAQAQAGLICSITVIINTRTRTLAVFVIIAPPTLGVCLLGGVWCPSESWPKPINRCGFAQESVLDPRGGSLLVNRLPLLGDACKFMCKANRCVKKSSLERPCA